MGQWGNTVNALAKSRAGSETPYIQGGTNTLIAVIRVFFRACTPVMAGCPGDLRVRRPLGAVVSTRSARHPFEIETSSVAEKSSSKEAAAMATTPAPVAPEIRVINGKPITTSIAVSQFFRKQHKDVIRKIESLDCSPDFTERNFTLSEYEDSTGRQLPCYNITRDGFTFLAMGFTGKRAAAFKEAYIAEFNRMEAKLSGSAYPVLSRQRFLMVIENGKVTYSQPLKDSEVVVDCADIAPLTKMIEKLDKCMWDLEAKYGFRLFAAHAPEQQEIAQ